MGHWNWGLIFAGIGALAALAGVVLVAARMLANRLTRISEQNEEQLDKQRAFERDWNGEEARPGHPRTPGMVERVSNIENNTAPIPGQIEELRGRVGKLEEERLLDRQQLERHLQDHI